MADLKLTTEWQRDRTLPMLLHVTAMQTASREFHGTVAWYISRSWVEGWYILMLFGDCIIAADCEACEGAADNGLQSASRCPVTSHF